MAVFLNHNYLQKPEQYGSDGDVQSSIFKNAERVGIDPASIEIYAPLWNLSDNAFIDYSKNRLYAGTLMGTSLTKISDFYRFVDGSAPLAGSIGRILVQDSTLIIRANLSQTNSLNTMIGGQSDNILAGGIEWGYKGSTKKIGVAYYDGAARGWYESSAMAMSKMSNYAVALNKSSGVASFFENGKAFGTASTTTANIIYNSDTFDIGHAHTTNLRFTGDMALFSLFNVRLKDEIIAYLSDNSYYLLQRQAPVFYLLPGGGVDVAVFFDGKIKIISASSILLDGLLKIKDDALNLLNGQVQISEQTSATNLLDSKVVVQDTAIALLDGSMTVQDSAAILLDGLVAVSNVGQDTLDGSVNINDDRITILDGKLVLKSAGMNLFDGTVTVQNIAQNYLDGKAQIKSAITALLDGKIVVQSKAVNMLDGKMLLESGGTVYDLLDGKIVIKSVTTDHLDGLISIQDYSTLSLDGKLIISKNSILNLDGKVTVKDIAFDLLDGKIAIKTDVVNLFEGKLSVKTASIGLLDGEIIIGDEGATILDGKLVIVSDSATNVFDGKIILTALAHGKVTITFDLKTPGITFDLKTPGITFSVI